MAVRMLIDATHAEETRVAIVKGDRLEDFDFESTTKKTLKGNIYLAKVMRVEPSLQAAFVDYGGNRHGFLAFSEIHPDYYQIPVADRQRLLADQASEDARASAEEAASEALSAGEEAAPATGCQSDAGGPDRGGAEQDSEPAAVLPGEAERPAGGEIVQPLDANREETAPPTPDATAGLHSSEGGAANGDEGAKPATEEKAPAPASMVVSLGGDAMDEVQPRRRFHYRQYRIQEVIKRRQIILVQVVKEERGSKGAALTTYLSLAGRYCVLMPNTPRGGGISRKIVAPADRQRLRAIVAELEVPKGMGMIVRTAGLERSKNELKRDLDYLVRTWDSIRATTLGSTAPSLVHEEANLIKRAIRDLYQKDIDEVVVEGEEGYRAAKEFMKILMPSHARKVRRYRERIPLFHRYQVEQQFDEIYSPSVQLKSGGSIVLTPTEALVAIDVNSGKSTREHNIEETATKTNLEAADEVARQLRLRDLAGLIVVDFIDMEDQRNQRAVERRLRDALKADRARIQVGRISSFGLLEMSRQRLRPSLLEATTLPCPHCQGRGYVRSIESTALHILRAVEEEGIRGRSAEIEVRVAPKVAFYLLNRKREALADIQKSYGLKVVIGGEEALVPPDYRIERLRARGEGPGIERPAVAGPPEILSETVRVPREEEKAAAGEMAAVSAVGTAQAPSEGHPAGREAVRPEAQIADRGPTGGKRRRRRRRRGEKKLAPSVQQAGADKLPGAEPGIEEPKPLAEPSAAPAAGGEAILGPRRHRRRGRRGGRRRRQRERQMPFQAGGLAAGESNAAPLPEHTDDKRTQETPSETSLPAKAEDLAEPWGELPGDERQASEAEPTPERDETGKPPAPRRGWWRRT
jgi:ribonuclease E